MDSGWLSICNFSTTIQAECLHNKYWAKKQKLRRFQCSCSGYLHQTAEYLQGGLRAQLNLTRTRILSRIPSCVSRSPTWLEHIPRRERATPLRSPHFSEEICSFAGLRLSKNSLSPWRNLSAALSPHPMVKGQSGEFVGETVGRRWAR